MAWALDKFKTGKSVSVEARIANAVSPDGKEVTITMLRAEHLAPIGDLVALYVDLCSRRRWWMPDPFLKLEIEQVRKALNRIGSVRWGD